MKKVTKINYKTTEVFYPSISDMMQDIKKLDNNNLCGAWALKMRGNYYTYGFNYFPNYEEAEAALIGGKWETGIAELNNAFTLENKNFEDRKRQKMFYDVVGYQASVPRYLQGLPTNMVNSRPVQKQEKVITIVKHIGYICDVTANQIIENSAKALTVLSQLEKRGVRCNLDVYSPAETSKGVGITRVRIKTASERLSIGKLAFPLANPDMLRRFVFLTRAANCQQNVWDIFDYSSGSTIYDISQNKKNLEAVGIQNCIFLNNFINSPETELRRNGVIK